MRIYLLLACLMLFLAFVPDVALADPTSAPPPAPPAAPPAPPAPPPPPSLPPSPPPTPNDDDDDDDDEDASKLSAKARRINRQNKKLKAEVEALRASEAKIREQATLQHNQLHALTQKNSQLETKFAEATNGLTQIREHLKTSAIDGFFKAELSRFGVPADAHDMILPGLKTQLSAHIDFDEKTHSVRAKPAADPDPAKNPIRLALLKVPGAKPPSDSTAAPKTDSPGNNPAPFAQFNPADLNAAGQLLVSVLQGQRGPLGGSPIPANPYDALLQQTRNDLNKGQG